MKLLIICPEYEKIDYSGQGKILKQLIGEISRQNEFALVTTAIQNTKKSLFQHTYVIEGKPNTENYLKNIFGIIKFTSEFNPDLIIGMGLGCSLISYLLSKMLKIKWIQIIYELYTKNTFANLFLIRVITQVLRKGFKIIVTSNYIKNFLKTRNINDEKILLIRLGLEKKWLLSRKPNLEYDFVFWGDAQTERGIDIVYGLAEIMVQSRFLILIREIKENGKKFINQLEKLNNVKVFYYPYEKNLLDYISKAKIVLLPFRGIGLRPPLSLIESMALGKCVVTSKIGVEDGICTDNENSVIVDIKNINYLKVADLLKQIIMDKKYLKIGLQANRDIDTIYTKEEINKIPNLIISSSPHYYETSMFCTNGSISASDKEKKALAELLELKGGEQILDVGTGSGRFARFLLNNYDCSITGFDVDREMLRQGEILKKIYLSPAKQTLYDTMVGNGEKLPFEDNHFDRVFSIRVLKYYKDALKGISEIIRVVKRGGIIVIEVTNHNSFEAAVYQIKNLLLKKSYSTQWGGKMDMFDVSKVRKFLLDNHIEVKKEVPVHKIPPVFLSYFDNIPLTILKRLDWLLTKITPKYFLTKSIFIQGKKT